MSSRKGERWIKQGSLLRLGGRVPIAMVAACPFPANRGTPIRIQQMGEALNDLGFDVHVVAYHFGNERPVQGMTIHRIKGPKSYREFGAGPNYSKLVLLDPLLIAKLTEIVRLHRIRVVHAHHFEGALCALATKRLVGGIKVIYDAHTSLRDELLDYQFKLPTMLKKVAASLLDSFIPRWSDHIVSVSDSLRHFIREQGVPDSKITVVPMAVNVGEFPILDRDETRRELNLRSAPTVLYTGNLAPFQGVDHLLHSMRQVVQERSDARLVIVGKPNHTYLDLTKTLGLSQHVEFAGERSFDVVRRYLAAADVVVLPRDNCPGFPLKLLNYMAAGKAIVAFRGSSKEVLEHGMNGYVVPDGDEAEFARGIIHCLDNRSFSDAMGDAARRTAITFNPREMLQRVEGVYKDTIFEGALDVR